MLNLERTACSFAKDSETMLNFRCLFLRMITYMMSLSLLRGRRCAALTLALLACPLLCPLSVAAPGAKKAANKKPSAPPSLSAIIQSPIFTVGDPKMPGRLLAVVKVRAFQGGSVTQGFLGDMTQVHARLYQQGKPSATLDAPRAHGSQNSATKNVVIIGTGGVVIKSLTEPGTRLTADTVVWYASINRIVASGHAVYYNSKTAITFQSPTIIADTKLKSVHGGQGSMSGKL